jgi:hypothetical protein
VESDGTVQQSSRQAKHRRDPAMSKGVVSGSLGGAVHQSKGKHADPISGGNDTPAIDVKTISPHETEESSSSSFHINAPQQPVPTEEDVEVWKLHYNRPPMTSIRPLVGPESWSDLQRRLQLNEETVSSNLIAAIGVIDIQ